ncbi:MAG: 30S ribosomal protein S9 [Planctomycetota bacterium]
MSEIPDPPAPSQNPEPGALAVQGPPSAAASGAPSAEGEDPQVPTLGEAEEEIPQIDPTGRLVEPGGKLFHWGTGRRKTAVARVRIRPGSGQFQVNGKDAREFFTREFDQHQIAVPLKTLQVEKKVDVFVNCRGGGPTGQAGAIRMGLGRALEELYPDAHEALRDAGHLSRDPRQVERKKYGRRGARRSFQWSKR